MIAVTGASGQLGQRVLHHLLNTLNVPAANIIAASRNTEKLKPLADLGVTVRALDFDDPATLATAFEGASRVLLISTDVLGEPGRRLAQHKAAVTALERAGVDHVVYTSMPKPDISAVLFAPDHLGTEQALAASRIPGWTILRNHFYFENLPLLMGGAFATGTWYKADAGKGTADISRDDLALAAATVLGGDEAGKQVFTLSGPAALTKAEIAAKVGGAVGREFSLAEIPHDALVAGLVNGAGLPEPIARIFASFETNVAEGHMAEVTSDFERITGRQPQGFDDWLAANKSVFAAL